VQRSEAKLYRGGRPAALDTPSTSFQALGQRVSNQSNRLSSQANRVVLCNAVKQNCIEVGVLLPSVHFGFSINYIPYVLYGQNTRSAFGYPPRQPSESKANRVADAGGCIEVGVLYRGWRIVHITINYYLQVT
jgi:hypothetical protein